MTDVVKTKQHSETDIIMSPVWGLQLSDYAPKARTQLFDIHDSAEVTLEKLLKLPVTNGWGVDAICINKAKQYNVQWEDFSRYCMQKFKTYYP